MSSPGSILIVDDTPQNIQVLGSLLHRENYSVSVVLNGRDALKMVEKTKFDLILLDVMMPEMNGLEVCEKLKLDPRVGNIPVIFLTARSDSADILKGFEVGGVDYVTKPFQGAELLARVKTHISLHRARREIEHLRALLPICSGCKKIRNDGGFWQQVEEYFAEHSDVQFTHGICQDCVRKLYPEIADKL